MSQLDNIYSSAKLELLFIKEKKNLTQKVINFGWLVGWILIAQDSFRDMLRQGKTKSQNQKMTNNKMRKAMKLNENTNEMYN